MSKHDFPPDTVPNFKGCGLALFMVPLIAVKVLALHVYRTAKGGNHVA